MVVAAVVVSPLVATSKQSFLVAVFNLKFLLDLWLIFPPSHCTLNTRWVVVETVVGTAFETVFQKKYFEFLKIFSKASTRNNSMKNH